jgi:predicted alpha/beta hydrolase
VSSYQNLGFTALTYEFRDIGESTQASESALTPAMIHWGQHDMDAVLSFFIDRHPEFNIKGIGHSIGDQLLGIVQDNNRYESFLNVASQHIYWKN